MHEVAAPGAEAAGLDAAAALRHPERPALRAATASASRPTRCRATRRRGCCGPTATSGRATARSTSRRGTWTGVHQRLPPPPGRDGRAGTRRVILTRPPVVAHGHRSSGRRRRSPSLFDGRGDPDERPRASPARPCTGCCRPRPGPAARRRRRGGRRPDRLGERVAAPAPPPGIEREDGARGHARPPAPAGGGRGHAVASRSRPAWAKARIPASWRPSCRRPSGVRR